MNKYFLLCCVLLFGCQREETQFIDTPEEETFTILNGMLSGVLREDDSPYYVTEGIQVDLLQQLTIEAGTRIFFNREAKFLVRGELLTAGDKNYPVVFTAFSDSGWGGIIINGSLSSELRYCRIEKINMRYENNSGNGAVMVMNSDFKMNNCIIEANRAINGGGLYLTQSIGKIRNNIFRMNYSEVLGGGVLSEHSTVEIINNLFYENEMNYYGGAVVLINNDTSIIQNNIIYKNTVEFGEAEIMIAEEKPGVIDTAYNFFGRNNENPEFISENDFHLKLQSPCRNAGNPDPIFNDYDGTRNDQGPYGGLLGNW